MTFFHESFKEFYQFYVTVMAIHSKENAERQTKDQSGQGPMSLVVRKPVFGVSDQGAHIPGCTATGDG